LKICPHREIEDGFLNSEGQKNKGNLEGDWRMGKLDIWCQE
jgi:hypothetical protein